MTISVLKRYKSHLIVCLIGLTVGGVLGSKLVTSTPQIVTNEVVKERIVTRTKVVTSPDGTVVSETDSVTDKVSDSKTIVSNATKPQWNVSVDAGIKMSDELNRIYGVQVQRRLFGPIFAGVRASTDGTIGVVASFEF